MELQRINLYNPNLNKYIYIYFNLGRNSSNNIKIIFNLKNRRYKKGTKKINENKKCGKREEMKD
jgi:hypothetical protein